MRVLTVGNMYPPHHLGGYELMWRSAVEHLRASGHDVRVLTTDYRAPSPDSAIDEGRDVHRELRWYWHAHRMPRRRFREILGLERHNREVLTRHLDEFRPEAISWWAMGGMSMALIEYGRRFGLPAVGIIVDNWMTYGLQADAWQRTFGRPRPLAAAVERVTSVPTPVRLGPGVRWVFVSEHVRRRAAAVCDLSDTAIAHGGIDPDLFRAAPSRPWQDRLLYLGRLDPRKGVETGIRALAFLPRTTLTIVGDGDPEYAVRLRALVGELGLDDRVSFAQHGRTELPDVYAEADTVLFPVIWPEPWGLVPLEAMAVGRPVIATGTGGSAEYMRDRENCLLFEPHMEPRALAAAVERLAADPGLRSRLIKGGRETVSRFTETRFNEAIEAALTQVAG